MKVIRTATLRNYKFTGYPQLSIMRLDILSNWEGHEINSTGIIMEDQVEDIDIWIKEECERLNGGNETPTEFCL